jgi:hypothetical protein
MLAGRRPAGSGIDLNTKLADVQRPAVDLPRRSGTIQKQPKYVG